MKKLLVFLACYAATFQLFAQTFDFGCLLKLQSAAQTNDNPQAPQDGVTQWDAFLAPGVNAYGSCVFFKHLAATLRAGYVRKGYEENAQLGTIGDPASFHDEKLHNTSDNINLDVLLGYRGTNKRHFKFDVYTGLQTDFLLKYRLESDKYPINEFYPTNQFKEKWSPVVLNYVAGIGLWMPKFIGLSFEFSRGVTPNLRTSSLRVKNWVWALNLILSVNDLLRKD